jgi:hypothetical protein
MQGRKSFLPWKSNKYFVCVCVFVRAGGCPFTWACAFECVHVALLIQHATRMHHIVTSFVASINLSQHTLKFLLLDKIVGYNIFRLFCEAIIM